MKRLSWITASLAVGGAALVPATASAAVVEVGSTPSALVAPTCPKNVSPAKCTIVLTQMTALETIRDGVAYPTTIKQAGRIAAFTVGLSTLSSNRSTAKADIHYLDQTYGGTTQVALTVLKPSGAAKLRKWTVVAQSPIFHVQPYLGQVVQLPLTTSLAVVPGEVVALTTPTWAPVLSIDLSTKKFAYRQSRTRNCNNPPSSTQAQLRTGTTAQYTCNYPGTRVEYSATEITNPIAAAPIHARRYAALRAADPPLRGAAHPSGGVAPEQAPRVC
jgi:hypothetical protein